MEVFTPKEVAAQLKVTPRVVLTQIRNGKLQAMKIGSEWRLTDEHLSDYIQSRTTKKKKS